MEQDDCICRGNWRAIIKESDPYITRLYMGPDGEVYRFFGVVHGSEDYYYGMHRAGQLRLLSCVGSIEGHGYKLLPRHQVPPQSEVSAV